MGLRRKMATGAVWRFLDLGLQQLSALLVFAVIARLIGPEEYGLVSMCYIFLALASAFITGLVDPIISLQIKDDLRLSTLFWTVLALGAGLSLLTFGLAGPFALLMGDGRLTPMLQVFAALPVLVAAYLVPASLLVASLDFRAYTIRTFISTLLGGAVGIGMALKGYGAYALFGQQLVLYLVTNAVVWATSDWRPKRLYSLEALRASINLGLSQSGSSFVQFFVQNTPRMMIGFFCGPAAAGQLVFVMRLRHVLNDCLMYPIISVIHPAFSSIQDRLEEQSRILDDVMALCGFLVFPFIALAAAMAPVYIPLFFGSAWTDTVPLLLFYFISAVSVTGVNILGDLMRAHKQIPAFFRMQIILAVVWVSISAPLARQGVRALLLGDLFFGLASLIVYERLLARCTGLNLARSLGLLLPPLVASACAAGAAHGFLASGLWEQQPIWRLAGGCLAGSSVFLGLYCAIERKRLASIIAFVKAWRGRGSQSPETDQAGQG